MNNTARPALADEDLPVQTLCQYRVAQKDSLYKKNNSGLSCPGKPAPLKKKSKCFPLIYARRQFIILMSSSGGPKDPRPLHSGVRPKGHLLNLANVIPPLIFSTRASIRILPDRKREDRITGSVPRIDRQSFFLPDIPLKFLYNRVALENLETSGMD